MASNIFSKCPVTSLGILDIVCFHYILLACFDVLQRKYQEDFESMKDQIYFMQTETPEYKVNKQAGVAASKVQGHFPMHLGDGNMDESLATLALVWGSYQGGYKWIQAFVQE